MFSAKIVNYNEPCCFAAVDIGLGPVKHWSANPSFCNLYLDNVLGLGNPLVVHLEKIGFCDDSGGLFDIGNNFHLLLTRVE